MPLIEMHIKRKFRGTSTETKLTTGVSTGDEWVNTDTGETFVWTGTEWKATAPPQLLFGLASFYADDMLIADDGISAPKLKKSSVLSELPILLGQSPRGLASDSTGVKHETANTLIPSWVSSMFSAAYWEVALLQLTGGTVALELYDGASVIASVSLTATTYRTRSTTNILPSIAGKEVRGRLNVISAGAAGSLAGDAFYKVVLVR